MSTENFIITKRDGTQESFSLEKIKSAILKAFANVSEHISAEQLKKIVDHLMFCNGMSVEDIQNQVEVALMAERHFKAAKAFMLYRQRHMEDRETADKLRFLMDYCDSANAATGSRSFTRLCGIAESASKARYTILSLCTTSSTLRGAIRRICL